MFRVMKEGTLGLEDGIYTGIFLSLSLSVEDEEIGESEVGIRIGIGK